jgi:formylglycine-generating enzyme required for sulfatase activity
LRLLARRQGAMTVAATLLAAACSAPAPTPVRALPPEYVAVAGAVDAATGWPARIVHRATGIVMALVPAGDFVMGSPLDEPERLPSEAPRRSRIAAPFYLGTTEVTQAQWRAVMATNPSHLVDDAMPVDRVCWHDCQRFCEDAGGGLRLPREVEWEHACRAGTTTPFAFGATITPAQANYHAEHPYGGTPSASFRGQPVPAGSLPPNAWGLHEMHGNVWEWCDEEFALADAAAPAADGSASGSRPRVVRGGSWAVYASLCRSAFRGWYEPTYANRTLGLRVAWSPPR